MAQPKTWDIIAPMALTSGQMQTLNIPVFGTIEDVLAKFMLNTGAGATLAAIKAQIANIELNINGTPIVSGSPTDILAFYAMLQQRVGVPAGVDGLVDCYPLNKIYSGPNNRMGLGIGTGKINSIQLKITAGTLTTITSVGAFIGRLDITRDFGVHGRLITYPRTNFNSIGTDNLTTLPTDDDSAWLLAMIAEDATGVVASGQAKVNNKLYTDTLPRDAAGLSLSAVQLKQPDDYFVYNWTDGSPESAISMKGVTSVQLNTTFSVAPTNGYNVLLATLHGLA